MDWVSGRAKSADSVTGPLGPSDIGPRTDGKLESRQPIRVDLSVDSRLWVEVPVVQC